MKYLKIISLLVLTLLTGINIGCERDDLCPGSTPTTPNLIVDFYDVNNQESKKKVVNLAVSGIDDDGNPLPISTTGSVTQLALPLKTYENTTQFIIFNNFSVNDNGTPDDTSDDFPNGNPDLITINYSREEVFVSRACGYKTIFKNVTLTVESDNDNWIKARQPLNDNQSVEDETTTHFNIFH
ncbi:DUF6452 family protein [Aestuariibaculum sediminum]|uniref:Uncharacterized protein n=1 Tax=Aestuariibaculum sediminum TaxID=2770637 RepID=A0A8J6PZQ8_9FLAO|nr:DUF6452 family protein [Aestuariibaculum sediminum]MBD0831772.1 hypothetical protein [Aestuariibaculum sediminum]